MRNLQTATVKICASDRRLYAMVKFRIEHRLMNIEQAIRLLRSELCDKEYFELVGREHLIGLYKSN
jgi:hypothetical protein